MSSKFGVVAKIVVAFIVAFVCFSLVLPHTPTHLTPVPVIKSHAGNTRKSGEKHSNPLQRGKLVPKRNDSRALERKAIPPKLYEMAKQVFDALPDHFLPGYKSPCWMAQSRDQSRVETADSLLCLPYFYILGMPKCGTTDLWYRIARHPDVYHKLYKEPHWWTRARIRHAHFPGYLRRASGMTDLLAGNSSLQSSLVYGDGSASTLWDNKHWREIFGEVREGPRYTTSDILHVVQPDARLLVILREPVARLYSDYLFFNRRTASPEIFHGNVVASIKEYRNCTHYLSERACAYGPHVGRLFLGLYAIFLRDWFRVFPRDQMLIIRLEDWHEKCTEMLVDVFAFLKLETLSEEHIIQICHSRPRNMNAKKAKDVGPMMESTRKLLTEFYAKPNQELGELLGSDSYLWR